MSMTQIKMRPMIFSTENVKAILEGRKSQTRRVIKPQPEIKSGAWYWKGGMRLLRVGYGADYVHTSREYMAKAMLLTCPDRVGDRLFMTQGASSSKSIPFMERFWSRIIKFDNHWEWIGHTNRKKYGTIKLEGRDWSVHRLMWKLEVGDIPASIHVLHKCDMPWCVNPDHLYLGTNDDNIADKIARNRLPKSRGVDNGQSTLRLEQVDEIRSLYWEQWLYQREIAEQFNISQSEVSRIVNSKRWFAESEYPDKEVGHRTLEITGVRVERVQEISNEDAKAEGSPCTTILPDGRRLGSTHKYFFRELWDSFNAKRGYGWNTNPWVFVREFEVVDGTKDINLQD